MAAAAVAVVEISERGRRARRLPRPGRRNPPTAPPPLNPRRAMAMDGPAMGSRPVAAEEDTAREAMEPDGARVDGENDSLDRDFLFLFARVLVYFARIHGGCCFLFLA